MKNIRVFFAVLLTVVTLTHSRPSQAAVSIFTGGATAIMGLKVIGVGVVGGLTGMAIVGSNCSGECLEPIIPFILGSLVVALGVVILDGEQQVQFNSLDKKSAGKLGVTDAERKRFNEELDQVNMLLADVASEMAQLEKPTSEDSVSAWNNVKDLVDPLTFSAMTKIASQK